MLAGIATRVTIRWSGTIPPVRPVAARHADVAAWPALVVAVAKLVGQLASAAPDDAQWLHHVTRSSTN